MECINQLITGEHLPVCYQPKDQISWSLAQALQRPDALVWAVDPAPGSGAGAHLENDGKSRKIMEIHSFYSI